MMLIHHFFPRITILRDAKYENVSEVQNTYIYTHIHKMQILGYIKNI